MAGTLPPLNQEPIFKKLQEFYDAHNKDLVIKNLFINDPKRFSKYRWVFTIIYTSTETHMHMYKIEYVRISAKTYTHIYLNVLIGRSNHKALDLKWKKCWLIIRN